MFQKSLLNIEIRQTYYGIKKLQKEQSTLRLSISLVAPDAIVVNFFASQDRFFLNNVALTTIITKRKYDRLLTSTAQHCDLTKFLTNTKAIHNATGKLLPPETVILLSLGPKFALPYKSLNEIPFSHIIADLENVIVSEDDRLTRERIRCSAVNIVQNFIHRFADKQLDMLSRFLIHAACNVTRRFIKSNSDVIIVESDKGKQTVVMYEKDYDDKMQEMLSDKKTYLAIKVNPTWGHQKTNNSLVSRLRNLALIDAKTPYRLKTTTAQCPRIYGLPKVHELNMPLRPVVSNIGAPSYMLSNYVGQIIQASIKSDFNIKDSFSFCSYINSIRLPEDYVLVSFDVTSLSTSIPTYMIPGIIINRWQDKSKTRIST
ncbi:uncharacterized protein LOC129720083 [Wyeomyia smithii]|uniref:uncharacterized protein LOC129720083 n=1 Tax=Wyeomyia smithii TaxID=174621 RepID=UPI002467F950|nr:uncharacterized protein LOC129720083 [Wyeomyia smithii]